MVERTRWFARSFAFDLEPSAFPNIVERVRGTPARLEERVRDLDAEALTTRVEGAWSITDTDEPGTLRVEGACDLR